MVTRDDEFKAYDAIEIELRNYNGDDYITYKGHFIRYTKDNHVIIVINTVELKVDIKRIRKVNS